MIPVRQSTAFECSVGPVLDADGVAVTDCVVGDFKIKKTTGNFAALNASATLTHVSAGTYDLVLTTSDLDTVGLATIAIDDTVNACAPLHLQVMEEAIYDALYAASANAWSGAAGSSIGTANVTQFGGSNGTFSGGRPEVNTSHAAGTAWNSGAITASTLATDCIDNDAIAASAVTEFQSGLATSANQTTILSRIGTPSNFGSGADLANNLVDIESQTDDIGAAGAGLTAADDAILAAIAALNNLSSAQAQSAAESALQTYHLDHLIHSADPGGVVANSSFLAKLVSKSATPAFSDFDNTTDSLQAQRDNVGTAGAGLTNIDLPDQTFNLTGNITGSLSGSVGSVTGAVGSVTAAVTLPTIPVDWITSSGMAASAVTEIQSGLSTLDAAGVRTAVGLASANLDTQLGDLPTANENADALLDRSAGIETGVTPRQALRAMAAVLCGVIADAGTGDEDFAAIGNSGTPRVGMTVDASGNRSVVDLSL